MPVPPHTPTAQPHFSGCHEHEGGAVEHWRCLPVRTPPPPRLHKEGNTKWQKKTFLEKRGSVRSEPGEREVVGPPGIGAVAVFPGGGWTSSPSTDDSLGTTEIEKYKDIYIYIYIEEWDAPSAPPEAGRLVYIHKIWIELQGLRLVLTGSDPFPAPARNAVCESRGLFAAKKHRVTLCFRWGGLSPTASTTPVGVLGDSIRDTVRIRCNCTGPQAMQQPSRIQHHGYGSSCRAGFHLFIYFFSGTSQGRLPSSLLIVGDIGRLPILVRGHNISCWARANEVESIPNRHSERKVVSSNFPPLQRNPNTHILPLRSPWPSRYTGGVEKINLKPLYIYIYRAPNYVLRRQKSFLKGEEKSLRKSN
eukprot:gene11319-7851_t